MSCMQKKRWKLASRASLTQKFVLKFYMRNVEPHKCFNKQAKIWTYFQSKNDTKTFSTLFIIALGRSFAIGVF